MSDKKNIPLRAAERFFLYFRFLKAKMELGAENVFSHELSLAVGISPEQVRQDLRLLNVRGTPQQGYPIRAFLADLNGFLSLGEPVKAVLVGAGGMGQSILSFFSDIRPNLQIVAAFDSDMGKKITKIAGCPVYNLSHIAEIIRKEHPLVGIIAVSPTGAQQLADDMAALGIRGILNLSSAMIKPPAGVFLEQLDVMMSLEKTVFFARNMGN